MGSAFFCAGGAPAAVGRRILTRPSSVKWLESMRNTTSTSTTSMNEISVMSTSSVHRGLRFMGASGLPARLRRFQLVGEANGVLLDLDHDLVDLGTQGAMRQQRRDSDDETRSGRDERLADAARQ